MGPLIHNQTFRILDGDLSGMYRVVLAETALACTAVVLIEPSSAPELHTPEQPNKSNRSKKAARPLCGKLLWLKTELLDQLFDKGVLQTIELQRENFLDSQADLQRFEWRKKVMGSFVRFDSLRTSIRTHASIGRLVAAAVAEYGVSRTFVYTMWSLLCRYGFTEEGLRPRFDRCGAPGKVRDCSPTGRAKAGRKTNGQRLARKIGQPDPQVQPGMSSAWRQLIMMADRMIPTPKPSFPKRCRDIVELGFSKHFCEVDGEKKPIPLKFGEYPNKDQIRRVLDIEIPALQRLLDKTTKGHYQRNMRGMKARGWKGVAGPGHTWQIDSTVADIYLRSSINREWIIGRPILYIIVDVWSTAIVGFYVCLRGPSWEMAKVALFSALTSPESLGELWGYAPWSTLYPHPGPPIVLLCDRGEYLSQAAMITALGFLDRMSYAAPYRPDLKGLVEVMHRITKDHQYWVPGAIDARRAEYELRKFDTSKAVFTVSEYTALLHNIFTSYNLTADRRRRMDVSMTAAGVIPSPAGLWRWGHEAGIGIRQHRSQSELIKLLLPEGKAKVSREGISFNKLAYGMDTPAMTQWTAKARNFGGWDIPIQHFPGSVSRIWTPDMEGAGLHQLMLTDQANASSSQTYEETLEAFAYEGLNLPETNHDRLSLQLEIDRNSKKLVKQAKERTAEAISRPTGPKPSITVARQLEALVNAQPTTTPARPLIIPGQETDGNDSDAFSEMMMSLLKASGT